MQGVERDAAIFYRDQLRAARAQALGDAEGYPEILFAIERLGSFLAKKSGSLVRGYSVVLSQLAQGAVVAGADGNRLAFGDLLAIVATARNDALHQGAAARHLTSHAVRLALVLEEALVAERREIRDFMVQNPTCAALWQPLTLIRHSMLANAFSYLPVPVEASSSGWGLVSDTALARFLRAGQPNRDERDRRLHLKLAEALAPAAGGAATLTLSNAQDCSPTKAIDEVVGMLGLEPLLVIKDKNLIGIVTAFDLL